MHLATTRPKLYKIVIPRSWDVQEEVVAACKAANAHEFILEMEEGYETRVGEKGRC